MNNTNNKYFISDSYPMIVEEDSISIIEQNENENTETKKESEIISDLIYMPWQVINETPTIS